jgi:protein-S-isoprenylcysteine O-methyltransferase Ste14
MLPLFVTDRLDGIVLGAAYIIWVVPEVLMSFSDDRSAAAVDDRSSGPILFVCIWLGILAGYWAAFDFSSFAIPVFRTALFFVGIALMLMGVMLRQYAVRTLGEYFTLRIAIHPGQTVVAQGPYRFVRHPSYSGALLTIFGLGLVFTNWLSLLAVLVLASIGYTYRVSVEEKALLQALGDPYREYMQRTKRFIPFVV